MRTVFIFEGWVTFYLSVYHFAFFHNYSFAGLGIELICLN